MIDCPASTTIIFEAILAPSARFRAQRADFAHQFIKARLAR
jgi:hypothetical protein